MAQANEIGGKISLGMVATVLYPTQREAGQGFFQYCFNFTGMETIEGETHQAFTERVNAAILDAYKRAEDIISGLEGAFLGGDAPDIGDVFFGTMLFYAHNCLEAGISKLPQAPCSLTELGCPALRGYVERWVKRDSWRFAYKTDSVRRCKLDPSLKAPGFKL